MTRWDYETICREVAGGEEHAVMNQKSHAVGKVLQCHRDYFNVSIGEGWQVWARDDCESTEPGLTDKPMAAGGTGYDYLSAGALGARRQQQGRPIGRPCSSTIVR